MREVHFRGGFSDRNGIVIENTEMQVTQFDVRTRTALISTTRSLFSDFEFTSYSNSGKDNTWQLIFKEILSNVYAMEVDWNRVYESDKVIGMICETIREDSYHAVLTVIEFFANVVSSCFTAFFHSPIERFNIVFEREYVGYRFVGSHITPITNSTEVSEISEAAASPYKEVNSHLEKSIKYLSDRTAPDYENSIKESISAVERMCSIIIGKSTTLGDALKQLEKSGLEINSAMKAAFQQLYGYTCEGSAIRHAGKIGGPGSTFEEAKFMLVSCSAFVNYLIGVLSKHPG